MNIVHVEAGAATVMPASCKALCTHTTDTYNNYIYYLTCCRQRLWTERPRGMVLHIDTDIFFERPRLVTSLFMNTASQPLAIVKSSRWNSGRQKLHYSQPPCQFA